eukprot:m.236207 g.236207  ORF g.236207 m.236207 type:complete len:527 (-) comp18935_c0_seq14:1101-2681(-)
MGDRAEPGEKRKRQDGNGVKGESKARGARPRKHAQSAAAAATTVDEALENHRCRLCKMSGFPRGSGRLLGPFANRGTLHYVHENCALYSAGVYHQEDDEKHEFTALPPVINLRSLFQEVDRAKVSVCSSCESVGATVNCAGKGCPAVFHFPCVWGAHCQVHEFKVYCPCCPAPPSLLDGDDGDDDDEEEDGDEESNQAQADAATKSASGSAPPPPACEEEDVFFVEKILQRRKTVDGECEYEVKWAGYETTTWEPSENIFDKSSFRMFNLALNVSSVTGTAGVEHTLAVDATDHATKVFDPERDQAVGQVLAAEGLPSITVSVDTPDGQVQLAAQPADNVVPKYLVQFKNAAHSFDRWVTKAELMELPNGRERLRSYLKRRGTGIVDRNVRDTWLMVDRIVVTRPSPIMDGYVRLVKWRDLGWVAVCRHSNKPTQPSYTHFHPHFHLSLSLPVPLPPLPPSFPVPPLPRSCFLSHSLQACRLLEHESSGLLIVNCKIVFVELDVNLCWDDVTPPATRNALSNTIQG